jgi:hypothetical protein
MRGFVYKYDCPFDIEGQVSMPAGGEIISVLLQEAKPRLFALVDPLAKHYVARKFEWYLTGDPIERPEELTPIGSVVDPAGDTFIWHLFERK